MGDGPAPGETLIFPSIPSGEGLGGLGQFAGVGKEGGRGFVPSGGFLGALGGAFLGAALGGAFFVAALLEAFLGALGGAFLPVFWGGLLATFR